MQRGMIFALGFLGSSTAGFLILSFVFLLDYVRELSTQSAPFDPTPTLAKSLELMLAVVIAAFSIGYVSALLKGEKTPAGKR